MTDEPLLLWCQLPRRARRYGRRWLGYSDLLGGHPDPRENGRMRSLLAGFRAALPPRADERRRLITAIDMS